MCRKDGILDKELTLLGYVASAADPGKIGMIHPTSYVLSTEAFGADPIKPPEFKPNETRFQTSSWYDTRNNEPAGTGDKGNSILNYLLYKQTTGTHFLKPEDSKMIVTKENWTPGRADESQNDDDLVLGRLYISKRNFFDSWLIPKLSVFNKAMHACVYDSKVWCNGWSQYTW